MSKGSVFAGLIGWCKESSTYMQKKTKLCGTEGCPLYDVYMESCLFSWFYGFSCVVRVQALFGIKWATAGVVMVSLVIEALWWFHRIPQTPGVRQAWEPNPYSLSCCSDVASWRTIRAQRDKGLHYNNCWMDLFSWWFPFNIIMYWLFLCILWIIYNIHSTGI